MLEEAIGHAIGSDGISIWVDRDLGEYAYVFKLRARRYNKEFEVRVKVGHDEMDRAVRNNTLADLIGHTAELLANQMMGGFAQHLQSLGLR